HRGGRELPPDPAGVRNRRRTADDRRRHAHPAAVLRGLHLDDPARAGCRCLLRVRGPGPRGPCRSRHRRDRAAVLPPAHRLDDLLPGRPGGNLLELWTGLEVPWWLISALMILVVG